MLNNIFHENTEIREHYISADTTLGSCHQVYVVVCCLAYNTNNTTYKIDYKTCVSSLTRNENTCYKLKKA